MTKCGREGQGFGTQRIDRRRKERVEGREEKGPIPPNTHRKKELHGSILQKEEKPLGEKIRGKERKDSKSHSSKGKKFSKNRRGMGDAFRSKKKKDKILKKKRGVI